MRFFQSFQKLLTLFYWNSAFLFHKPHFSLFAWILQNTQSSQELFKFIGTRYKRRQLFFNKRGSFQKLIGLFDIFQQFDQFEMLTNNSSLISPLPKITVQHRAQKLNSKITQMIKKLGKRRQMQIIEERSQGFWMEDQVKLTLDRIKLRAHKMKTLPVLLNTTQLANKDKIKRHKTYDKNIANKKPFEDKHYLPQLKLMVQAREYESNKLIIEKRRKILHLLILGLNRRNLGRLHQALDIILLASFYFEKDDEERVLKSICLSLISKLHKQIKKQSVCKKKKSLLTKKRKSLTVLNYISRENFLENFMIKLRKTKLVGQFSYAESKHHSSNTRKINGKCDVVIPKPEDIFEPELSVLNYDYIAVTVDDYTNSFPYQYPKSLSQKIGPTEYKQMICKLNGLLFPESKCYSFSSIIKLFYLPFMLIFILILGYSILRTFILGQTGRIILIVAVVLLVLILGIKISVEEAGYTNYIEIKDKMKEYLEQWQRKYEQMHIKFRMGENVDAIFIVFPSEYPDSSLASSKLTQIQEVDQNFTERHTQAKVRKQDQSSRARRTGSRFDDNGNLMRKKTLSKYAASEFVSTQKINQPGLFNEDESKPGQGEVKKEIKNESKFKDEKKSHEYVQSREAIKTLQPGTSQMNNSKQKSRDKSNLEQNQRKNQEFSGLAQKKTMNLVEQGENSDKISEKKSTLKRLSSSTEYQGGWKMKEGSKKVSHKQIKIEDSIRILKKSTNREQASLSSLVTPQSNLQEK